MDYSPWGYRDLEKTELLTLPLSCCYSHWLHQFIFPPVVQDGSHFSTPSSAFIICRLLMMAFCLV